jgi:glucans biosynthesis protein
MPKRGNAVHLHAAPRCGAHARTTGQPCKAPAIRGKVRCRMHGGRAGRKPIHGRYSKAAVESRREVRAILRAVRELIDT